MELTFAAQRDSNWYARNGLPY